MNEPARKIRQSMSRGTPSYQLGHYEMSGDPGKRRSVFKVDVHLGEHSTSEDALSAWSKEVRVLENGRPRQAEKLRAKMEKLRAIL
jgi:hypothetical protein